MPQSLVVGNGNLLCNIGPDLQLRDVYYPYIGQENHTEYGSKHRVGVWVAGQFRWLDHPSWTIDVHYEPMTIVGHSVAVNDELGIELTFRDFVYTTHDAFLRHIKIKNQRDEEREVRLFFGHDFYLYGDKQQDTAQYEPALNAVLHYRKERYFLVNGQWADTHVGLSSFSVGKSQYGNKEGTWKDAEDGHLHENPIEQGSVDSCVGMYKTVAANSCAEMYLWLCAGENHQEVEKTNHRIITMGPERVYAHTSNYWREWVTKHNIKLNGLSDEITDLWHRSLLMIRTQTDNRGAIIASNDSDIMKFNKDTYTYMWPRDGALVSMTLSRTGYFSVVERFLRFCEKVITPEGYIEHKFTPDGSLGSSWHPKWKNGKAQLPIQEDESALVLVALWEYYRQSRNIEVAQSLFNSMVLKIGDFLLGHTDPVTHLPKPSYDLWEEQYGIFTYTAATKYAGLVAAAELSKATGHYEDERRFRAAAGPLRQAICEHLYDEEAKRFVKRLTVEDDGTLTKDTTVDASIAFIWMLGVLPAEDPRVVSTIEAMREHLTVHTETGGLCRYPGDTYHKNWDREYGDGVPGNPWIITTLWLANWYIRTAKTHDDLQPALELIEWATGHANSAGILPEQMDPFTKAPLSVGPLTWSHSTYVDTVLRYSDAFARLTT